MAKDINSVVKGLHHHNSQWATKGRFLLRPTVENQALGPTTDMKAIPKVPDEGCIYQGIVQISDSCFTCPLSDCYLDASHKEVREYCKIATCVHGHDMRENFTGTGSRISCKTCKAEQLPRKYVRADL